MIFGVNGFFGKAFLRVGLMIEVPEVKNSRPIAVLVLFS